MIKTDKNQIKFNIFSFLSTFARSLIEIFISLYLFKNGYLLHQIILFYFLVNIFAIPLSYWFVKLGEKTKYTYVMIIGLIAFILVQLLLRNITLHYVYLITIALLYSIYRRGYWVARRFYITTIMPTKKSSSLFSIVIVISQLSSIAASYVGSFVLSNVNFFTLTIISSTLLSISIIPLFLIPYHNEKKKIKLKENLKKYDKSNYIVFSFYELNNILTFIFPIYIATFVENSYSLAGNLNAVSNIAILLFVLFYGKILNKNKNYLISSTILVLTCFLLKLGISNTQLILFVYFIEGLATKMQYQSVNKIYFENRKDMDLTHYNLIYQIIECFARALITLPLLWMSDIRVMILFVIIIINILLLLYIKAPKKVSNS
mgnify:FL=1